MKVTNKGSIISKTLLNLLHKAKAGFSGCNRVMIFMFASPSKNQS